MSDSTFYVTTPIYYVNDAPHIGHGYTTVMGDIITRWHRQRGESVWYLTGTDEHGQKVLRKADQNGVSPQDWVDKLVEEEWKPLLETIDIANDDYIRTTEQRHLDGAKAFWQALYERDAVYKGAFSRLLQRRRRGVRRRRRRRRRRGRRRGLQGLQARRQPGRAHDGGELLLPAQRLPAEAPRLLRGQPRLHPARVGAQRADRVRQARPARPVDLALDVRLGHPGAVGRQARHVRLDRGAAQLRDGRRATASTTSGSRSCGRPTSTSSARTSPGSTPSSGPRC